MSRRLAFIIAAAALTCRSWAADPQPSPEARKPGIRTEFGDVQIDNLGIGRTYNLRELAGTPLKVTNTGPDTVNLIMSVEIPTGNSITPQRREAGFKPVPSLDWVSLGRSQFVVPSGDSAYTDVIIKIPDDPVLYGKKFQADIYSRTTGGEAMVQLGVWSHLQMSIVQSPDIQAQIEKNRKRGAVGSMEYTLLPDKIFVQNAPLGKPYDIKKELKRTIMIANSGADPISLRVRPVPLGDTPLSLQSGYEEGNPAWLSVKSDTVKVPGSSFADPGLTVTLPNDPKLSGKAFMFAFKVEPADPDVVAVTYYAKVYVEAAK